MMKRLILLGVIVFGLVSAAQADIRLPWGHFEPGLHAEALKKKQPIAYLYADVYTKSAVEEGVAEVPFASLGFIATGVSSQNVNRTSDGPMLSALSLRRGRVEDSPLTGYG